MIHLNVLNPRQAEAGKIKIGRLGEERDKRSGKGTYQLPEKFDHFILTTTERDDSGNFELDEKLMKLLEKDPDGKIREIPILFSSDLIDEIFPHYLACYWGQNLHCRGDGQKATRYEIQKDVRDGRDVTIKTGRSQQIKCPCDYLGADSGMQCRPHGTLWPTIVAGAETQIGARHSFRTTSWDSIRSLLAGLAEIQRMVGTLVGTPLTLQIRPRKVKPRGQTAAKVVYVVHVICRARDIQELRQRVLAQAELRHTVAALAGRPLRLGLPAPGDGSETPEDQSYLQQEYHPDEPPHDPVTGEVLDTDAIDPPAPEPESQAPEDPDAVWPEDHPGRAKLGDLCKQAAVARGFEGETLRQGATEVYQEACERAQFPRLPWKSITTARAQRVAEQLNRIITEARSKQ